MNYFFLYFSSTNTFRCFPTGYPLYAGVIAPFGIIFLFNLTVFVIIMISINRRRHNKQKLDLKQLRRNSIIAIVLVVTFAVTWIIGFLASLPGVLGRIGVIVFTILVSFHGVLLFILHTLRSQEVRQMFRKWIYIMTCRKDVSRKKPDTTSSGPKSSHRSSRPTGGTLSSNTGTLEQPNYRRTSNTSSISNSDTLRRQFPTLMRHYPDTSLGPVLEEEDTVIENRDTDIELQLQSCAAARISPDDISEAFLIENPINKEASIFSDDDRRKSTPSLWSTWEEEEEEDGKNNAIHSVFMNLKSS